MDSWLIRDCVFTTSNLGPELLANYLQICYNGLSLQQWYQVHERVLSFSFIFFAFVALKKIPYILAEF